MHYDAITHTQKAIRNLQSQVRLLLRRHQEQGLPYIGRRSNVINYRENPTSFRSVRQKSQFESPGQMDSLELKQMNTISFDEMDSRKVNLVILKPRVRNKAKLVLPKFQTKHRSESQNHNSRHSLQLIEHSLVEQSSTLQPSPKHEEPSRPIPSPRRKHSERVARKARYGNKTRVEEKEDPVQEAQGRKECYSPWERDEETELVQIESMCGQG